MKDNLGDLFEIGKEIETYSNAEELSKKIGVSQTAVYKNLTKLKQKKLLKRIGPAKGGHWEIVG